MIILYDDFGLVNGRIRLDHYRSKAIKWTMPICPSEKRISWKNIMAKILMLSMLIILAALGTGSTDLVRRGNDDGSAEDAVWMYNLLRINGDG